MIKNNFFPQNLKCKGSAQGFKDPDKEPNTRRVECPQCGCIHTVSIPRHKVPLWLTDREREVYRLVETYGQTMTKTAEGLGVDVGTVSRILKRVKRKIADSLRA